MSGYKVTGDKLPAVVAPEPPEAMRPKQVLSFEPETATAEKASRWRVPKGKKLKKYAFDVYGNLHQGEKYTPEQWEALKARLGAVIEVEASNQPEAWKLYDERKKQGQ